MKFLLSITCFLLISFCYTQNLKKISLDSILDKQITDEIKVVGLGDIGPFPSEEISSYAFEISKFLIKNKEFKNVFVPVTDILLRPFNDYINSDSVYEKEKIDSIFAEIPSKTKKEYIVFKISAFWDLISFLKKYNLENPQKKISLHGTEYSSPYPSYFFYKYISPLDKSESKSTSQKWIENITEDYVIGVCQKIVAWHKDNISQIEKLPKNQYYNYLMKDVNSANTLLKIAKVNNDEAKIVSLVSENLSNEILNLTEGKSVIWSRNHLVAKSSKREKSPQAIFFGSFLNSALKDSYYAILFDFPEKAEISVPKKDSQEIVVEHFFAEKDATIKLLTKNTTKQFFLSNELKVVKKPLKVISIPYNFGKYPNYITLEPKDFNLLIQSSN